MHACSRENGHIVLVACGYPIDRGSNNGVRWEVNISVDHEKKMENLLTLLGTLRPAHSSTRPILIMILNPIYHYFWRFLPSTVLRQEAEQRKAYLGTLRPQQ